MIDVIIWALLKILRMNGQNLTKFFILIITDKIYVGIVMRHQFFIHRYAPEYILPSDSAMAGLQSDPQTILVSLQDGTCACPCNCASILSNINISETSGPSAIEFYLKHQCVGGEKVLICLIRALIVMATCSSHRVIMGEML